MPGVNLAVAIPSLIGSITSLLATTTFAILYFFFPPRRHFRQYLVINLLLADWINSLNNATSGIVVLSDYKTKDSLDAGPGCTANAYIGQFSVQAIGFNILLISVSVLLTIRKTHFILEQSWQKLTLVCLVPWIMPVITSNIGLGLGIYGPVTGNWCWITTEYFGLRYALTHGWRIAISVATIAIYTYIYITLKRQYGRAHGLNGSYGKSQTTVSTNHHDHSKPYPMSTFNNKIQDTEEEPLRYAGTAIAVKTETMFQETQLESSSSQISAEEINVKATSPLPMSPTMQNSVLKTAATHPTARPRSRPERQLRKMLLLNGYPILYILLWLPGIANRVVENFGPSPVWLQGLQATTQFMGFADVITYAYNEQLFQQVRKRYAAKRSFQRSEE